MDIQSAGSCEWVDLDKVPYKYHEHGDDIRWKHAILFHTAAFAAARRRETPSHHGSIGCHRQRAHLLEVYREAVVEDNQRTSVSEEPALVRTNVQRSATTLDGWLGRACVLARARKPVVGAVACHET